MRRGPSYLLLACWLCACAAPAVPPPPTPTATPIPPSSTPSPSPSPTSTATATATDSPTLTPEPTATPVREMSGSDVVVRQEAVGSDILAYHSDGSVVNLSDDIGDRTILSLVSPDGQWVVIGRNVSTRPIIRSGDLVLEIWLARTDGSFRDKLFLGTFGGQPYPPSLSNGLYTNGGWSSDSQHLMLNCPLGESFFGVCFVAIRDSKPTLIHAGYEGNRLSVSPDGQSFLFWRFGGGGAQLRLVDPAALQPRTLATLFPSPEDPNGYGLGTLMWSHDSQSVNAFVVGFRRSRIYNVQLATGAVTRVAELDGYPTGENITVDHSRIAFFLKPDGKVFPELIVMNFEGSEVIRLETRDRLENLEPGNAGGFEGYLRWTPDGRLQVGAYSGDGQQALWDVDLEAGTFTRIQ